MVVSFNSNPVYFDHKKQEKQVVQEKVKYEQKVADKDDNGDIFEKGCTDGKDDGKIGATSAIYHVGKGVVNTGIDMVKSCIMDENGDLSIGRMAFTAGVVGAGILCPPLALAACAIGGAVGAAKVVNGIYNVANAKTDAQAKEAFETLGNGAFTAATSAFGARASLNAIKTSAAKNGGVSELQQLADNASITEKALALGKDSFASAKNNITSAKDTLVEMRDTHAQVKLYDKVQKIKAKKNNGKQLEADDIQTISQYRQLKQDKKITSDALKTIQDKKDKGALELKLKDAKEKDVKHQQTKASLEEKIKGTQDAQKKANLQSQLDKLNQKIEQNKSTIQSTEEELKKFSTVHKLKQGVSDKIDSSNTVQSAKSFTKGVKQTQGLINKCKTLKSNINKANFSKLYDGLSADAKAILNALTKNDPESVISKYGYENVAGVVAMVSGEMSI